MNLDNLTPEVLRVGGTMLLFGLGAVVITFLVATLTKVSARFLRDGQALDVTMLAQVTGKRSRMQLVDEDNPSSGETLRYYVSFEPDGKRVMELEVSKEQYDTIMEGVHGYLTVKDRSFVSFTPEDEIAGARGGTENEHG